MYDDMYAKINSSQIMTELNLFMFNGLTKNKMVFNLVRKLILEFNYARLHNRYDLTVWIVVRLLWFLNCFRN